MGSAAASGASFFILWHDGPLREDLTHCRDTGDVDHIVLERRSQPY
jgi:hypothetical protein